MPAFTDCYCTQFRRTSGALTKIYDDALKPAGLRITQFSLLRGLGRLKSATLTELADESALDLTTISRNVKLLGDLGWIEAAPAENDKRQKVLRLSKSGRDAIRRALPYFNKAQRGIEQRMAQYMDAPQSQLLGALQALQGARRA